MTSQIRRESYSSTNTYSQSDYSSDEDATIGDAKHQSVTTPNRNPRTPDTATKKADVLTRDDSDADTLEQMLLSLQRTTSDTIFKAAGMAKSMNSLCGEACQQTLDEALRGEKQFYDRKEHYKNETKNLEKQNRLLKEQVDDLKERANTLQAEKITAREKVMELFRQP